MNQGKVFENYILGRWISGEGSEWEAKDARNGLFLGSVSSAGVDFESVLAYGRTQGGPPLRRMTFPERGRMLKALAFYLSERKERYYALSAATGATRADSWIDIEGGIGNLFANASLRREFADLPYHIDGEVVKLSQKGSFVGHHIMLPKKGVAVHINAFNFPIWGMLEKIAVNLLAGVPAVVKPSEFTSFLTEAVVRDIIASRILPEGALQLLIGKGVGLLNAVQEGDVVTFTGSSATGLRLKSMPLFDERGVPFNLEADSLNAMVLGPEATPGTPEFALFIKEATKEITSKTGQKCTAVRRILAPRGTMDAVQEALMARLRTTPYGDPAKEGVRMGPLATQLQVERVRSAVEALAQDMPLVMGEASGKGAVLADAPEAGAYFAPVLFRCDQPMKQTAAHSIEAFGPVSTLMAYDEIEEAAAIVALGRGSLATI